MKNTFQTLLKRQVATLGGLLLTVLLLGGSLISRAQTPPNPDAFVTVWRIADTVPRIFFNVVPTTSVANKANAAKLLEVRQWGKQQWASMQGAFRGCSHLRVTAKDVPDLSKVTNMSQMFTNARKFNQDISRWNVSNVTNMAGMFVGASAFNQPLNRWSVSKVTDMSYMLYNASAFNQALNSWNVSRVTNMSQMFTKASRFNQPLNSWDVSKVANMSAMFGAARAFNQPLNTWNVANVTNMSYMFREAIAFD